ncbi:hypothetical protein MNB_SV-4-811 [hydrothermal vent metagenome]|uniref:Uncharacterized protein n=1 Tax=hydrothermal vent metagenome TaxID=652676 RepID=A0A1W1E7M9_9ZZZZ
MKKFDDYEFKDTKTVIRLQLKQIKEKKLYPWEVSNFLGKFNTYYYKSELLNTIAIALNEGIDPEDIIILDQSFALNRQYAKLSFLSTTDQDLVQLYYIGLPVPLFPNKDIYVLNILFKYFRKYFVFLNKLSKSSKAVTIQKKNLPKYYNVYKSGNFDVMFSLIKEDVLECLKEVILEESTNVMLNKIHNDFKKEYEVYLKHEEKIEQIKTNLIKNDLKKVDFNSIVFKTYFKKFHTCLSHVQRPIVVVNNTENNILSVLCRAQFNKSDWQASTLDLESISHNSPFKAILKGGSALYRIFIPGDRQKLIDNKEKVIKELNSKLLDPENEAEYTEIKKELQQLEKEIETLKKINVAEQKTNSDNVEHIVITYIKSQFQNFQNKIQSRSSNLLSDNNFKPDLGDTEVYDFDIDV